jgi:hypothetical protein
LSTAGAAAFDGFRSGDVSSSSTSLLSSLHAFLSDAVRFSDADRALGFELRGAGGPPTWTPCSRDTDPDRSKLVWIRDMDLADSYCHSEAIRGSRRSAEAAEIFRADPEFCRFSELEWRGVSRVDDDRRILGLPPDSGNSVSSILVWADVIVHFGAGDFLDMFFFFGGHFLDGRQLRVSFDVVSNGSFGNLFICCACIT